MTSHVKKTHTDPTIRLNQQHNLLFRVLGQRLLPSSIPLEKVHSVADVGTGTGYVLTQFCRMLSFLVLLEGSIWLQSLASQAPQLSPNYDQRYYHGFDIGDAQFPSDSRSEDLELKFTTQDVLKPFPRVFRSRFDLVHVRLFSFALQEVNLKIAMENLLRILSQYSKASLAHRTNISSQSLAVICTGKIPTGRQSRKRPALPKVRLSRSYIPQYAIQRP